jgi:hypothetical protein
MHSHMTHSLAAERSRELRQAGERARLAASLVADEQPPRRRRRIARLRVRIGRLTARSAETGS